MKETWRWYGWHDPISRAEVAQTGAAGIASALHDIPYGEVWPREAITVHRDIIAAAGFSWKACPCMKRSNAARAIFQRILRATGNPWPI